MLNHMHFCCFTKDIRWIKLHGIELLLVLFTNGSKNHKIPRALFSSVLGCLGCAKLQVLWDLGESVRWLCDAHDASH